MRAPKGIYSAVLKFSENHYNEIGVRSFDVFVEDSLWISNLDVFDQSNIHTAFDTMLNAIRVEDGILDLYFSAVNYGAGYEYAGPFLNGLEIHLLEELSINSNHPKGYSLSKPFPNPFNNQLSIPIELVEKSYVEVDIFSINGLRIKNIYKGSLLPGYHNLTWDAKKVASGIYFIQLNINNKNEYEKTILLK